MIRITTASQYSHKRVKASATDVSEDVRKIIADVRARGDEALREYAMKFDGIKLERLEVSQEEFDEALNIVGERYIEILTRSAENIRAFHSRQLREGFMFSPKDGVI